LPTRREARDRRFAVSSWEDVLAARRHRDI
jgi:hypothetical protein